MLSYACEAQGRLCERQRYDKMHFLKELWFEWGVTELGRDAQNTSECNFMQSMVCDVSSVEIKYGNSRRGEKILIRERYVCLVVRISDNV